MGSSAQQFGVPQLQRDYIETLLLQESYERRLISIDHDQIRINAECIHVDPVTANALGQIVGIISVSVLHWWTVDDFPLLQDFGQGVIIDPSRIGQDEAGAQSHKRGVNMAAI